MTTLAQQVQATITERFPTASVEQLNLIQSGAIAAFDTLETKGYAVASADATPVFQGGETLFSASLFADINETPAE